MCVAKLFRNVVPIVCVALLTVCAGCGGGSKDDPCTAIKIAGGNECEARPLSVAAVISGSAYCTGTFITKRHVLTAAHCVPVLGEQLVVATKGFSAKTSSAVRHPGYVPGTLSAKDVAILTIDEDAPVIPVPLLQSETVEEGDLVVVYGYGVDENGDNVATRVEDGGLPLKATYLDVFAVNSDSVRTISDGGGDSCGGDSGGPVLKRGPNDEYGVVAVVSFGPNTCVPNNGLPSDNTNLQTSSVADFILEQAPDAEVN